MGVNDPDPTGSKIQLEILRERQRHSEDRIRQLERELAQTYTNLGSKEKELEQVREERADLNTKWEVLKKDLQYAQDVLAQKSQISAKKSIAAKFQAFFASILFLISSVLVNLGTSILISSTSNPLQGWSLLGFAVVTYVAGALMTTLLAFEGGS